MIDVKKGTSRLMVFFTKKKIVIKFPWFDPKLFLKIFFCSLKKPEKRTLEDDLIVERYGNIRQFIGKRFLENKKDYLFSVREAARNPFPQPTHRLLFFGFASVQTWGRKCVIHPDDFKSQIWSLTGGKVAVDLHHWENPDNFCVDENGKIRMHDYHEEITKQLIREFGLKIYNEFDFGYKWKKEGGNFIKQNN